MEMFQREMQVNFFGALALVKRVLPSMLDNGGGRVINMSARSFYRNLPAPGRGGPRLVVHREQGRAEPRRRQSQGRVRPPGDPRLRRRSRAVPHREGRSRDDRARLRPRRSSPRCRRRRAWCASSPTLRSSSCRRMDRTSWRRSSPSAAVSMHRGEKVSTHRRASSSRSSSRRDRRRRRLSVPIIVSRR